MLINFFLSKVQIINVNGTQFDDVILGKELTNQSPIDKRFDNDFKGGKGNDYLFGGSGKDTLTGFSGETIVGNLEIDSLRGGSGADKFILGNSSGRFYSNSGGEVKGAGERRNVYPEDYAFIIDFNPQEGDLIQLRGQKSQYYAYAISNNFLKGSGWSERFQLGTHSTGIVFDKDGDKIISQGDEVIGIVGRNESITRAMSLNFDNGFVFV